MTFVSITIVYRNFITQFSNFTKKVLPPSRNVSKKNKITLIKKLQILPKEIIEFPKLPLVTLKIR
jgi:hypothetical protein